MVRPLGYQRGLDGVRAVAVVAVVVYHFSLRTAPGGWAGVNLFFVLSGFLITSLLLAEADEGSVRVGSFYLRRVLRLVPALVVMLAVFTTALAIAAGAKAGRDSFGLSLRALSYLYNWFEVEDGSWSQLGHLWSLSVEEQFYVLWPLLVFGCLLVTRRSPRFRFVLIGVTAAAIVASAGLQRALMSGGASSQRVVAGTDVSAYPILLGCLLGELRSFGYLGARRGRATSWIAPASLVAFVAFVLAVESPTWSTRVAITAICALVIWGITDERGTRTADLMATRPMRWIGARSYGIYLWHLPAIILVALALRRAGAPSSLEIPLATAMLLVVTVLSYECVEQPFLRIKRRLRAPAEDRVDTGTSFDQLPS